MYVFVAANLAGAHCTNHFMLFLRKKRKCADSIYTPCLYIFYYIYKVSHKKCPLAIF